ncbi:MAG: type II toxin-antitoxin system RelE/ParE family toxin [Chloroflexi bacterium]|nr:type II toxin-antitoxin system RelE/ParE family toxin [Chloroflexota bacterium]
MTDEPMFPVEVYYTETFKKDVKRLKKRYRNIQSDLDPFLDKLKKGVFEGDEIQGFEEEKVYKARVPNSDAKRGKSGGYRVIYYIKSDDVVWLITMYSKSDQPDISDYQILAIIEEQVNVDR